MLQNLEISTGNMVTWLEYRLDFFCLMWQPSDISTSGIYVPLWCWELGEFRILMRSADFTRYQSCNCSMCHTIAYDTNISMAKLLVTTGMVPCCKLVQDNSLVLLSHKFCPCLIYVTLPRPWSHSSPAPQCLGSRSGFQNNIILSLCFRFLFTVLVGY